MALNAAQLLKMSQADLDKLFTENEPGPIPDGEAKGTAIIAPGGQRTTLTVTGGKLMAITNPAGEAEQFTYDGIGLMQTHRDPRGSLSQYRFNDAGRLVRDEDPAGGFISLVRTDQADGFFVTRSL